MMPELAGYRSTILGQARWLQHLLGTKIRNTVMRIPSLSCILLQRVIAVTCLLSTVATCVLWAWMSGAIYRDIRTPVLAVRIPGILTQAAAKRKGLQCILLWNQPNRYGTQFERVTYLGSTGHYPNTCVSLMGVTVAV